MGIAGSRNGRAQSQDMGRTWHILEQPNKRVEDQADTQFMKSLRTLLRSSNSTAQGAREACEDREGGRFGRRRH